MSKPRLPLSVLAALGLSATGMNCGPKEVLTPCLSIAPMPYPEDDSDTTAAANQHNNEHPPHIGPCLSPLREPPVGPCLVPPMEPPAEPPMTVCLSALPEPDVPDEPVDVPKEAPNTVHKAKQAVLSRGILPKDVAARLLRDTKD